MLKTSQTFSHCQRLANFIGNMQLPESSPATRVSPRPPNTIVDML